jgi:hypothetical protein
MKETLLLGALFPSHPDFLPIIQEISYKYGLPLRSAWVYDLAAQYAPTKPCDYGG